MAPTPRRNLEAMAVGELNQLHDIFSRAGFEHSDRRPMHDASEVVRSLLPRSIIEEQCPAETRQVIAQQLPHGERRLGKRA
jgi:hypothetical protein